MLLELDDPAAGYVKVADNPVKLSDAPDPTLLPPPQLGQQTDDLLTTLLGLSMDKVAELRRQGVV
jgi:crotonobetainyl-CoA:carnitine CoA-transferase CaiB-like acyl-CoA transferase